MGSESETGKLGKKIKRQMQRFISTYLSQHDHLRSAMQETHQKLCETASDTIRAEFKRPLCQNEVRTQTVRT